MRWAAWGGLLLMLVVAGACGSSKKAGFENPDGPGRDGGSPVTDTLKIEPADLVVDAQDGAANAVTYTAMVVRPDGTSRDVTSDGSFSATGLGVDIGVFSANTFNVAPGKVGRTTIQAVNGALTGTTTLTVRRSIVVIGPGASADAPSKFGGQEDASKKPKVLYPPDGVMLPPNMNVVEVHYEPAGNTLFELHVTSPILDLKVYFACQSAGSGCAFSAESTVWSLLSSAGRGAEPLTYTLRGTDGSKVGTSDKRTVLFGEEDILGGIYYWNAGAGTTMRYEFGVSGQTAETFMNAQSAGAGVCVGCHVLSRSGKKIALGMDIPAPAAYKVFDVATKGLVYGPGGANFFSFSPDESEILTSNGISIGLHKATDGTAVTDPLVPSGTMPDYSPNGESFVYARPQTSLPLPGPGIAQASLQTMVRTNGQWAPGPELVPYGGKSNYYPAYSPDGTWVIFDRSNNDSFDAPDAEVWVVSSKGGQPILLAKARAGGDSWPKWAPDVQKYRSKSLMWFTFSSRRPYGVRQSTCAGQNHTSGPCAQIWMAAFDPEAAAAGKDASYPALWLPFQDFNSGNHIAQWVTRVERKPCAQGGSECEGNEQCQNGRCVPIVK